MDALAGLSFRHTHLLWWLTAMAPLLVWLVARERRRRRLANRFVSERLRGVSNGLRAIRPWLISAALALAIIAVAGPQLGVRTVPVETFGFNRIVAVDVSNSMAARDVGTSRISAARAVVRQIADTMPGRLGLVVFEGTAEVVSPLTADIDAVVTLLGTIDVGEMSEPGSDLGAGIEKALELAAAANLQVVDIVLISDGEDSGQQLSAALTNARRERVAVHTVLIGSPDGATIPDGPRELRRPDGEVVITRADRRTMETIASDTGGRFVANPFDADAIARLQRELAPDGRVATAREIQLPIERYQWPLGLALLTILMAGLVNRGAD